MKKCLYCQHPQGPVHMVRMGGSIFNACERCIARLSGKAAVKA